ncbi:putative FeS-containing Cyanobacterial-specific oxidoreductase [Oscillibacter sp. CAG:241]|nr:putative FeS-containing Cyanobacterial-specific oxidoreductase [Oscillibacter sp. CAG:241]
MSTIITSVDRHSPAERAGITPGEQLLTINGHQIIDVLDYRFYGYDTDCCLELREPAGTVRTVSLRKPEGRDLGLNFDTVLMDDMRSCANHCIFCFVDQMPPGMRKTLYFKDDDARLSFLQGNYITLTNLTDREAQRIIDLRISPINVSVHTTDPQLHCTMLGNKNALRSLDYIRVFCKAGIVMNGQIVVCPGWNDGDQLRRTLRDLTEMQFSSCSLVPVGITKYRQGLAKLRPVDAATAAEIIDIADEYGRENLERFGTRRFFCADELYLRAGRPLPRAEYYEGYRQLENGVGLMRSLEDDFLAGLATVDVPIRFSPFTIATGTAAAPFLGGLVQRAQADYPGLRGQVIAVENDFFGHTIDVAGLLTGQDISAQLRGRDLGDRVLIPIHMMRHGETVFLDDYTVERLSRELGVPVQVVDEDGFALVDAMFAAE